MLYFILISYCLATELKLDAVDRASQEFAQESLELSYKRCIVHTIGSTQASSFESAIKDCLNNEWGRTFVTAFHNIMHHIPEYYTQHCLSGSSNTLIFDYELPRFLPPPPTPYETVASMEITPCEEGQIPVIAACLKERGAICKDACMSITTEPNDLQACLRMCQANVLSSCPIGQSLHPLLTGWARDVATGNISLSMDKVKTGYGAGKRGLLDPNRKQTRPSQWRMDSLNEDTVFKRASGDIFPCFSWGLCGTPLGSPRRNRALCAATTPSPCSSCSSQSILLPLPLINSLPAEPQKDSALCELVCRVRAFDVAPFEEKQKKCIDSLFGECDLECGGDQTCLNHCTSRRMATCIISTLVSVREKILVDPTAVCLTSNSRREFMSTPTTLAPGKAWPNQQQMADLFYWTSTPGGRPEMRN